MEVLFGILFFASIVFSLVWLATFAQRGRTPWAKRGFRYRRVRWTTAISATTAFILACVVAQGLPTPGNPSVGAPAPAAPGSEAGAAPADSTVDVAPAPEADGSHTGYSVIDQAPPNTPAEEAEGLQIFCAVVAEHGLASLSQPEQVVKAVLETDNRLSDRLHEPIDRANIVVTRISAKFGNGTYGPAECGMGN
jgi:hypothetical protein